MVVEWLCPGLRPTGSRRPRLLHCKVILLDEHELLQDVLSSNLGQELLDRVFRHLNLLETAYFGLRYLDHGNQTQWLDPSKKIGKQLKVQKGDPSSDVHTLYFGVKFYAADPCKLIEEITRYQFFLQVKQDILQGRLPVSFDLAAELGAYVVQSELGDYDPRRHSVGYVTEFRFLANQTTELENRIVELHKTLVGQLPSAAELNYLDKVKWLEMYGVDLHPVLGEDSVEYFLGLTPSGIILLRNKTKVGNYYWPRINKIYYKGRYFMLRVSEKNSEERTHGFETPSKGACRHLWKCCLEHQAFFRLMATGPPPLSPYSRFRSYSPPSGSEKHMVIRRNPPPIFQRTPSRRAQRRVVEGQEMVGPFVETPASVNPNPCNNPVGSNALCNSQTTRQVNNSSPRSTRSAPWTQSQPRGLYTSSSPRSVRSAGTAPALLSRLQRRSSSVESQSSGDSHSRGGHRRRSHSHSHRRHSRHSDCESELSRGSDTRSGHRKHRRKHRSSRSSRHELVDSEPQWREAQKRKGEGVQRAVVSHTEPRRRHRSRHRSPSQKQPLPDELRKHLEFGLIDTTGMSEQQRREIPYTVVQSQSAQQCTLQSSNSRLDDADTSSLPRTIGSVGKRNRRVIQHCRDGSYNLPPTRPSHIETKYYDGSRSECNMRKDFYYIRNNRILIGNNVDSGLGESTPQEFSSCCSSSVDSAKPTRVPQMQLGGEVRYELSSNQEIYPPVDTTLDAVLQPIISTLTRRQRNRPK
ncbi:band 4.1-like protein 4 isoform X1 [Osmia lignaria lignaria]|uniref:band 4.1-like protein 4 isoform X1 n=1 Tax=Osmia lignaria lignaria TaxID=1437193 RepID=UPI001478DFD4|nr:band 4.1-like protein 4 isoform X1 [Osmia lignaria]XP_034171767.1 band 4.1-like protein 4 isoform X1 [Osmia lignaria]XP_034171768.1 band 4.1-like protein 4 isoform X1 [Osmia lignaria]XP_034171769.1 band 4.1-like protein 4 isoform X1 [Osmia lignaria]